MIFERQRSIESRPRGGRAAFRGLNRANEILRLPVPGSMASAAVPAIVADSRLPSRNCSAAAK